MMANPNNVLDNIDKHTRLGQNWAVIAKFDVKPGCEAEWIELVQGVIESMKHEASFISTTMCCHPSDPGKFMLFEVWRDRAEFFSTQVNRDYRHRLMERLPSLIQAPVVFDEWYEMSTSQAE